MHTPVMTEYKGIVYRSKCEAMFARYLEIECELYDEDVDTWARRQGRPVANLKSGFIYEPDLSVAKYVPDFLVFRKEYRNPLMLPYFKYQLIEYKPSQPTKTCSEAIGKKCGEWLSWVNDMYVAEVGEGFVSNAFSVMLYYGSVWTPEDQRGAINYSYDFDWKLIEISDDQWNWMHVGIDLEPEIRSTRYDLSHS